MIDFKEEKGYLLIWVDCEECDGDGNKQRDCSVPISDCCGGCFDNCIECSAKGGFWYFLDDEEGVEYLENKADDYLTEDGEPNYFKICNDFNIDFTKLKDIKGNLPLDLANTIAENNTRAFFKNKTNGLNPDDLKVLSEVNLNAINVLHEYLKAINAHKNLITQVSQAREVILSHN